MIRISKQPDLRARPLDGCRLRWRWAWQRPARPAAAGAERAAADRSAHAQLEAVQAQLKHWRIRTGCCSRKSRRSGAPNGAARPRSAAAGARRAPARSTRRILCRRLQPDSTVERDPGPAGGTVTVLLAVREQSEVVGLWRDLLHAPDPRRRSKRRPISRARCSALAIHSTAAREFNSEFEVEHAVSSADRPRRIRGRAVLYRPPAQRCGGVAAPAFS